MSPVVFRHKNVAPCSRQIRTRVMPVNRRVGLEQVPEGAGVVLGRVDGQPVQQVGQGHADQERGQQAAARSAGHPRCAASGPRRACRGTRRPRRGGSGRPAAGPARGSRPRTWWRTSRGTRRTWPAPATISQTSLPSHSGPMVLMAARRPASSCRPAPCSMPTPKSNPSRMKKPVHRHGDDDEPERDEMLIVTLSTERPGRARPRRPRCAGAGAAGGSTSASAAGRRCRAWRTAGRRPPG